MNGHPAETSLNKHLIESYAGAAKAAGHEVRVTYIRDMDFDSNYEYVGYEKWEPLEPDMKTFLADLEWCEHFVMATPMWWGGLPAVLKGLIDRAFLPDSAFDPRNIERGMPKPMLTGRAGRIITTSGTPDEALTEYYPNTMHIQMRQHIFGFVGISLTEISQFGMASPPMPGAVDDWMEELKALAA